MKSKLQKTPARILLLMLMLPPYSAAGETYRGLIIAPESGVKYDRDYFSDWIDADGDGQNTRVEVLIEERLAMVNIGNRVRELWVAHTPDWFSTVVISFM